MSCMTSFISGSRVKLEKTLLPSFPKVPSIREASWPRSKRRVEYWSYKGLNPSHFTLINRRQGIWKEKCHIRKRIRPFQEAGEIELIEKWGQRSSWDGTNGMDVTWSRIFLLFLFFLDSGFNSSAPAVDSITAYSHTTKAPDKITPERQTRTLIAIARTGNLLRKTLITGATLFHSKGHDSIAEDPQGFNPSPPLR